MTVAQGTSEESRVLHMSRRFPARPDGSESARDQHSHGWSSCFDCLDEALAEGAIA